MEQCTFIYLSGQTSFLRDVALLTVCLIIRRNTTHVTSTVKHDYQALQCSRRTSYVSTTACNVDTFGHSNISPK